MKISKRLFVLGIATPLLLGGCFNMNKQNNKEGTAVNSAIAGKDNEKEKNRTFVSVQDYTGEGYTLRNGEKANKIAESHREEIDQAVKDFFLEKYKTKVIVHNVVGAEDGATVFIESAGNVHFYSFANVPIDTVKKQVLLDKVWSEEGQVEDAIRGGLYGLIFADQFEKLDRYFTDLTHNSRLTGKTEKSLQNVGGTGFMTPYYFITTSIKDKAIAPVYDLYQQRPEIRKDDLKNSFKQDLFNPENLKITAQLYMADKNKKPSKDLFDKVCEDITGLTGIPKAAYSIILNDNNIDKFTDNGLKDNSLKRAYPNYIMKQ